jgi:hypothetical protein
MYPAIAIALFFLIIISLGAAYAIRSWRKKPKGEPARTECGPACISCGLIRTSRPSMKCETCDPQNERLMPV